MSLLNFPELQNSNLTLHTLSHGCQYIGVVNCHCKIEISYFYNFSIFYSINQYKFESIVTFIQQICVRIKLIRSIDLLCR
jgi:hypothetical protein